MNIPFEAADEVMRIGDAELYDLAAIKVEMDRTLHPIVPLVCAMDEKCGGENSRDIRWGATTQVIMDTGQTLQIKDAWTVIKRDLKTLADILAKLAKDYKSTVMVGRTHGQQAQPITFEYKVAIWLDELSVNRSV